MRWPAFSAPIRVFFFRTAYACDTDAILGRGATNVPDGEWIKKLQDGRQVKFTYEELPQDGAFVTAQVAGNEVVYSVVLTNARNPLSHEEVESHFTGELSKRK